MQIRAYPIMRRNCDERALFEIFFCAFKEKNASLFATKTVYRIFVR